MSQTAQRSSAQTAFTGSNDLERGPIQGGRSSSGSGVASRMARVGLPCTTPRCSNQRPMGFGTEPVGSSGTVPGSRRMVDFHFLAEPAPQWASQRTGVKVLSSSGRPTQQSDMHSTFRSCT